MKTIRLIGPIVLALALLPTAAESTTDGSPAATTDPVSDAFGGGSQLLFENHDGLDRLLRGVTTPQWSMAPGIYPPSAPGPYNGCRSIWCVPGESGDVACQTAGATRGLSCSSCGGSFDSPLGGECG